jgi:3',5'-cyclic AMP phosphodiesterase CpdA
MDIFNILHLSDFHIASRETVVSAFDLLRGASPKGKRIGLRTLTSHNPFMLEGAARLAFAKRHSIDAILITGDLATTGRANDLETALNFVDTSAHSRWLSTSGKPTLRGADVPIRLLPGNHDRYMSAFPYFAGGELFDQIFQRYWTAGRGVQSQIVLQGTRRGEFLGIVSADLSLRTNADSVGSAFSYLGQGRVYADILVDLQVATNELRSNFPQIAIVWAVHFPPEYPNVNPDLQLLEGQSLLETARSNRVECIFSGHTHRALIYTFSDQVHVHCAGTSCHCDSDVGNHVHYRQIHVAGGKIVDIDHIDYVWSPERAEFIPAEKCCCSSGSH